MATVETHDPMPDTSPAKPLPLTPGDRVRDFFLPDPTGIVRSFYDRTRGRPIVIAVLAELGAPPARATLAALERALGRDNTAVDCFIVTCDHPQSAARAIAGLSLEATVLCAGDGYAAAALGIDWASAAAATPILVLDPNQRVLAAFENGDGAERAKRLVDELDLFVAPTTPRDTAPVLVVPRVFEPQFCDALIEAFHARGHEASGVYSLVDGNPVHGVDASVKRRLDHYVRDDDLTNAIKRRMGARLLPEIEKAFCFRVTRLEEFKVTCYRASDRGVFKPHRDNYSPQTVHRRFALTLNLNEDFEGGALRFPEYGAHLYRPRRGEAIVFSCSLLHEALEVTRGDRYVLVAFMYDDAGAQQKRAMEERLARSAETPR